MKRGWDKIHKARRKVRQSSFSRLDMTHFLIWTYLIIGLLSQPRFKRICQQKIELRIKMWVIKLDKELLIPSISFQRSSSFLKALIYFFK
ncbi:hypothetical protein D3H64_09035 [Atopobacter sp. AH10]|nr:hypothetical protein D3H64_09035 [Atopobacter sp. AH10]